MAKAGRVSVKDMNVSKSNRDPACVMAYSHDGFGLGHLRRNTNIASRFVQTNPESNVLLLVGCPPGAFFASTAGIDLIKIPSIVKVAAEMYRPLSLSISVERMKMLRASMIQKAAEIFKPDLFLVDHVPTGVWAELLPTLQMLRESDNPPRIILGMRDIVDAPEVVCQLWRRESIYEVLARYYDEILIYGSESLFDTASQYALNTEFLGKIRYCGYVCSGEPYKSREEMRGELGIEKEKLVVVTAGGGGDAYPILQTCLDAFHLLGDARWQAIVIAGPLMGAAEREDLKQHAQGLRVRILNHVQDNLSYLNAADVVVTMGGYNTLSEVLRLRKKALVLPRRGPRAEQIMRARLFAERHLIDVIYPDRLSPQHLAKRLMEDLDRDDYPTYNNPVPLDGAVQAASCLSEFLQS